MNEPDSDLQLAMTVAALRLSSVTLSCLLLTGQLSPGQREAAAKALLQLEEEALVHPNASDNPDFANEVLGGLRSLVLRLQAQPEQGS